VKAARGLLLAGIGRHAYNNEKIATSEKRAVRAVSRVSSARVAQGAIMDSWEDIGKKLDEEFARVRKLIETEIKPTTQRKTADALREAAMRLNKAADKLDENLKNKK
jgi:cytosine/adenosine deaminase-related metal-dependent hydrolase